MKCIYLKIKKFQSEPEYLDSKEKHSQYYYAFFMSEADNASTLFIIFNIKFSKFTLWENVDKFYAFKLLYLRRLISN